MTKLIVFFADLDSESGIGHVMRCRAIANSIQDLGLSSILILKSPYNNLIDKFEINKSFKNIHGINFIKNLDHVNSILFIDTYNLSINDPIFNYNWEKTIGIFDDFTPRYQVDIVLAQNLSKNMVINKNQICYNHIIIDDYFFSLRNLPSKISNKQARNIIISGGGTDPTGFVEAVYSQLIQIDGEYRYFVFTEKTFTCDDSRFIFMKPGPHFRDYLLESDTVFSTAGSTVWEILTSQICLAVGLATENQSSNYEIVAKNELAIPIGKFLEKEWKIDYLKCRQILNDSPIRKNLYYNMQNKFKPKSAKEIFLQIIP